MNDLRPPPTDATLANGALVFGDWPALHARKSKAKPVLWVRQDGRGAKGQTRHFSAALRATKRLDVLRDGWGSGAAASRTSKRQAAAFSGIALVLFFVVDDERG